MAVILINVIISIITSLLTCFFFLKLLNVESKKLDIIHKNEINNEYTFENYFCDEENKSFINVLKETVRNFDQKSALVLKGKSGSGKTHLLHAIQKEFIKNNKNARTIFISAEAFLNELSNSIMNKTVNSFRNKYRNLNALFIDDIDFLDGRTGFQTELLYILNALKLKDAFIAITTSKQKSLKEILDERLYTYFSSGLTVEIPSISREARQCKMYSLLLKHGCVLPDCAVNYLAEQDLSMSELTGIINKIVFIKEQKHTDITIEDIQKLFPMLL